MSVRLISQDNDTVIELGPADKVSLGRKSSLNIISKSVGRDHCTVTTGFILDRRVSPVVFANKRIHILRHGGATSLNAGQSSQVHFLPDRISLLFFAQLFSYPCTITCQATLVLQLEHGDILYLGHEGKIWKYGFFVDIPCMRQSELEVRFFSQLLLTEPLHTVVRTAHHRGWRTPDVRKSCWYIRFQQDAFLWQSLIAYYGLLY